MDFYPNRPDRIEFPCPGCGRECLLTPLFHTDGAARGTRHGHGVQHSLPVCNVYARMTPQAFLILATTEIPVLNADPHISVKQPDAPPLIVADMERAHGRAEEVRAEAERQQARDVESARIEAIEIGRTRDALRAQELELLRLRRRARWRDMATIAAVVAALLFVSWIVWYLWGHGR